MTRGDVDGKTVVSCRMVVEAFEFADRYPSRLSGRDYTMRKLRQQFERVVSGTPEDPLNEYLPGFPILPASLRLFNLFDVGRTPAGEPLDAAERLLDGERRAQAAAQDVAL